MSLLPSTLAVMMVVLLAGASSQLVEDAALSSTQLMHRQLAMARAGARLSVGSAALAAHLQQQADTDGATILSVPDLVVEQIKPDDGAELGDLPMDLYRLTSTGRTAQTIVKLQADYAMNPCDTEQGGCITGIRRVAWRSLSN